MAQADLNIANQSGAAFRADLNDQLLALGTLMSGANAPSTTYAYMLWADTTAGLLKMRNGANNAWITLRELDGTLVFEDGTAGAPALAFASDLNTGIYRIGADSIGITTGGVNRLLANSAGQVAVTLAGSAGTPSFTKDDDLNTGLFYPAADTVAITTAGIEAARIDSWGRLLVGTSTARANFYNTTLSSSLQVEGANDSDARSASFVYGQSTVSGPIIILGKHRSNSVGGTTVANNDDELGTITFQGSDGTEFVSGAQITALVDGTPGANDMPGRLCFYTTADGAASSTEAMRINKQQELLVGTVTRTANGGKIQVSNGITFPATQSACTDANTLDDYEEGTFTPTIAGTTVTGAGTYGTQAGCYTKVGNRVNFTARVSWSAHTGTGNMTLNGLPFTSANVANRQTAISIRHTTLTSPASTVVQAYIGTNGTSIVLESIAVAGGTAAALAIDTAADIMVAGSYDV